MTSRLSIVLVGITLLAKVDAALLDGSTPVSTSTSVQVGESKSEDSTHTQPCKPHPEESDVLELSSKLTEPIVIKRFKPRYPESARLARVQGVVWLEIVVTKEGKVRSACILEGLVPILDDGARKAVMLWQYKPSTRRSDGAPVAVYLKVSVTYHLE